MESAGLKLIQRRRFHEKIAADIASTANNNNAPTETGREDIPSCNGDSKKRRPPIRVRVRVIKGVLLPVVMTDATLTIPQVLTLALTLALPLTGCVLPVVLTPPQHLHQR